MMATRSQPVFSNLRMYPDMADTDYLPVSGVYLVQDPLEDFSNGYGYQNPEFSMTNAPFDPNLPVSGSEMPNWTRTHVNGWPACDGTPFGAIPTTAPLTSGARGTSPVLKYSSKGSNTPNFVPTYSPPSDSSSPAFRELESPRSESIDHPSDGDFITEPAPRKRGRPRHSRTHTDPTNNSTSPHRTRRSNCLPHKQVERKYREGLNMEFERLRRAIPTLPQSVDANIIGVAKPSKGMVLGAAIEYIHRVERERDEALDEVERLGGNVRSARRRP